MRFSEFGTLSNTKSIFNEVSMSPSSLKKWAAGQETSGMLVGIEFELIFPTDIANIEFDYSQDTEVNTIQELSVFFNETQENLTRILGNKYQEFLEDYLEEVYIPSNQADWKTYYNSYFVRNHSDLLDLDSINQKVKDQTSGSGQKVKDKRIDLYYKLLDQHISKNPNIDDELRNKAEHHANIAIREQYNIHDEHPSEKEWLEAIGVSTLKDAADIFKLRWPYYKNPTEDILKEITEKIKSDFGFSDVQYSLEYHSVERVPGRWIVEVDASIVPPELSYDIGVEIISPPLTITEAVSNMKKIWQWAKKQKAYTNNSTGLHINVSVPDFSPQKLDYTKLVLLSGDQHILQEFGRIGNYYANSALNIIEANLMFDPAASAEMLSKMRTHLNAAATKIVHNAHTEKYTSINTKDNLVEFRSPGGDYLSYDPEKLIFTLLRTAMSLQIATDDTAYQQEYAKKLYKLITQYIRNPQSRSTIDFFTQYAAGEISIDQLKQRLKAVADKRDRKKQDQQKLDDIYQEIETWSNMNKDE